MQTIKHRDTNAMLYTCPDAATLREAVERAVRAGVNLTMANLAEANLYGASLTGARLSMADLARANLIGADLREASLAGANLTRASLYGADLTRASLYGADLSGADLSGARLYWANLTGAGLVEANLGGANLDGARLTGADLSGATGLPEAPLVERLDAQILERVETDQACFDMRQWHCGTTHCRAGHAIDLAGKAGYDLETELGSSAAGALIYWRSTGRIPDFYASTEDALRDLRSE